MKTQSDMIRAICAAIVDAVAEAGPIGAPGGILYCALNSQGMSLDQFNQFMAALVKLGKLRKEGECYFVA